MHWSRSGIILNIIDVIKLVVDLLVTQFTIIVNFVIKASFQFCEPQVLYTEKDSVHISLK